ncbi:hypothetical protein GCM10027195_14680 [Comamonas sediminis]
MHIGGKGLRQRHGYAKHAIGAMGTVRAVVGMVYAAIGQEIFGGLVIGMGQRQIQRRCIDAANIGRQRRGHWLCQHTHLHTCHRCHEQQQRKNRRDHGGKARAAAQALEHGQAAV